MSAPRLHTVQNVTRGWTGLVTSTRNHAYLEGAATTVCGVEVDKGTARRQGPTFDTGHVYACQRCVKAVRKAHPEIKDYERFVAEDLVAGTGRPVRNERPVVVDPEGTHHHPLGNGRGTATTKHAHGDTWEPGHTHANARIPSLGLGPARAGARV